MQGLITSSPCYLFFVKNFCYAVSIDKLLITYVVQEGGYKVQQVGVYKVSLFFSMQEMGGYKVQQFQIFPKVGGY